KNTQFASVLLFSYDNPLKVTIEFETKDGATLYVAHEKIAKTPHYVRSSDFPVVSIYIPREDLKRMRSSLKLMNLSRRGQVYLKSVKVEDATEADRVQFEKDQKAWFDTYKKRTRKKPRGAAAPKGKNTAAKAAKAKVPAVLAVPAQIKFKETPGVSVSKNTVVDKDGMLSSHKILDCFLSIDLPASEKALKVTMKVHTTEKALLGILHDNRTLKVKRVNFGWGNQFDYMQTYTFTIPAERLKTPSLLRFFRMTKYPGEVRIKEMKIEAVK
ncbi:MAG: hypothetical protein IKB16_13760, partial [Lentisphaeria bacterium]|nr:hypothetical protein [Lentisphaeria bacterium]